MPNQVPGRGAHVNKRLAIPPLPRRPQRHQLSHSFCFAAAAAPTPLRLKPTPHQRQTPRIPKPLETPHNSRLPKLFRAPIPPPTNQTALPHPKPYLPRPTPNHTIIAKPSSRFVDFLCPGVRRCKTCRWIAVSGAEELYQEGCRQF